MTSTVGSHTWLVAAGYLAVGLIGAVALRAIAARLQRRAEGCRWRGVALAFLRLVVPWCAVAGCTWGAVLALPLKSAYRHDLNHALLAIIIVVISLGSAKVNVGPLEAGHYECMGEFHQDTAEAMIIVK